MLISKLRFAVALMLALAGGALALSVGTATQTFAQSPRHPYCSTNPYSPDFNMGGCGGGELALLQSPVQACNPYDLSDNQYCSNYRMRKD